MPVFPSYCPIRLDFDKQRMFDELSGLDMLPMPAHVDEIENRHRYFLVADEADYLNCMSYRTDKELRPIFTEAGSVPTWAGISLTEIPNRKLSKFGGNKTRGKFLGEWVWTADTPYTQSVIQQLPLVGLEMVKVMTIAPGGFGPTHVDFADDSYWEVKCMASINIVCADGGSPMRFKHDNVVHETVEPIFFFKDTIPHGVPKVSNTRMVVRLHGLARREEMLDMMDLEQAIW